jgi:hypothetical protein
VIRGELADISSAAESAGLHWRLPGLLVVRGGESGISMGFELG